MVRTFVSVALAVVVALLPSQVWPISQEVKNLHALNSDSGAAIPATCSDLMQRHDGTPPDQLTFAFFKCGEAYFEKGEVDRAIEDFSQAIKISPQFNAAFNDRGNAYLAKRDYDRAIQDFTKAISISPGYVTGSVDPLSFDYATVFEKRGSAYAAKHDYDRAVQDYSEAVRLKPHDARAFFDRGLAYDAKSEYGNAISDFDRALEIDPKNADFLDSRGVAYFHKSDYDRAMQDFNKAILLGPDDADAFLNRGILYNTEAHYDSAIADYDKALQVDPKNAYALYSRGTAKRNKDDVAGAQADQAAALQIDPNISNEVSAKEAAFTAATIHTAQGQHIPACTAAPDGASTVAQVPAYVDEPIEQLRRMVPRLNGMKFEADGKSTDAGIAGEGPEKTVLILSKTGMVIANLLRRIPDLIAKEEVRQPVAPRAIGGVGFDGARVGLDGARIYENSTRYETHFFTYRIVHKRTAAGSDVLDELRTDAQDRAFDSGAHQSSRPLSIGFATAWLFFFPGNLRESRFRYLGEQLINTRNTYVLAFAQIPEHAGLNAVVQSGYGSCSAPLQGVAWIDQSTFQIVQVETDLLFPLPGIQLNQLRSILSYRAVKIHPLNLELWLPSEVETSWQTAYGTGEETHLYSHYRLFKSTSRILPASESSLH